MRAQQTLILRLILVWLLLELVAAAQVRRDDGRRVLGTWLGAVAEPAVSLSRWMGRVSSDALYGIGDHQRLVRRVRKLRLELEEAHARTLLLSEDLAALREVTRLEAVAPELEENGLVARCTFRHLAQGRMQVSAGLSHGVRPDTAVVGATGLVGRVVRSRARHSWVELITHPAAAVAVRSEGGEVQGLAAGFGDGELRVEYVPRRAQLLRGTLLVTSGADGIYPAGLPVARVRTIRGSDDPFLHVIATPTAELATLRVVLLLPAWAAEHPVRDAP